MKMSASMCIEPIHEWIINCELNMYGFRDLPSLFHSRLTLPSPQTASLHYGDRVCLFHVPTKTVLSAYMSAAQAFEAQQIEANSQLSSSKRLEPCARNVFVIGR